MRIRQSEQAEPLYEESVLRFFAFLHGYKTFTHLVDRFLTDFAKDTNAKGVPSSKVEIFEKTMEFIAGELPKGIVRNRTTTPLNLYEAIAVGTALVFEAGKQPKPGLLNALLQDQGLQKFTQGGTNSKAMVVGRIEYVRDALL